MDGVSLRIQPLLTIRHDGLFLVTEYLRLRYSRKDEQVLINSKDRWVTLNEHPVTERFLNTKPAVKVTS
ncbi:MAG: hypothetical protein CBC46_02050 [Verrucomicrobiaceae bacterium TMED86]|nr:MAG: hypothetical protein CBC46_02050 [Verrucomicrobiaceae bacterium TMED86]